MHCDYHCGDPLQQFVGGLFCFRRDSNHRKQPDPAHISMQCDYVDAAYHHRGIGRKMFEAMRQDYARQEFTVNSSPCAVEVYRHLGFEPTDTEQVTDGLRYTPMIYRKKAEQRDAK